MALVQARETEPEKFTEGQQKELANLEEQIADLEERISLEGEDTAQKAKSEQPKKSKSVTTTENAGYTPSPGTEGLVHLEIVRGARYDSETGELLSTPYVQMFTFGEYKNFKANASKVGYTIVKELYNPYKEE